MSFSDEDEFDAFVYRDHVLPQVTGEAVSQKLLELGMIGALEIDADWLAIAVRRVLAITIRGSTDSPNRTSNKEIRANLESLAGNLDSIWLKLFECDWETERRIWEHSWYVWDGEGGKEVGEGVISGEPSLHKRYKAAVQEIDWLARFLKEVASETEGQKGPWRQSEKADISVERAYLLASIYEMAFQKKPTGNNYPSGTHHNPTDFMKFYQAMVHLAFDEAATANLPKVVKEACKLHRTTPATFAQGMLPNLGVE